MNAVSRSTLLLAITVWCRAVSAQDNGVEAARGTNDDRSRIVVLHDGGVLIGDIVREGEAYVVTRAGGQIRVPASRVLVVCASLEEAYDYHRRQMARPTAQAHLALADWCLRFGLVAQASRELSDAKRLDGAHPRLVLLERRLANAEREERSISKSEPSEAAAGGSSRRGEPAGPQNLATLSEVPAVVVERFTRRVQPILVNNCSASGCHQAGGEQQFQLDRALLHGLANRRSTMNNLAAALALVDREQPQLSPLLTVPRQSHGGMREPVFGPRQVQAFNHVVEWIALVTQADAAAHDPKESTVDADSLASSEALVAPENEASGSPGTALERYGDLLPVGYDEAGAMPAPTWPRLRFGARLQPWQPRDPFDPEIFNRQQRAKQRMTNSQQPTASSADP
jgi:hypothetical protein